MLGTSRLTGFTFALLGALAALLATHAPAAGAATIGELPTSGASCEHTTEPYWLAQAEAAAHAYTVPSGGGYLTSWSMAFGTAGTPAELLVLDPEGGGKFMVVGLDNEHLPSPLPSGNVSTFNLPTPIHVQQGDTLGLVVLPGGSACAFTTPSSEDVVDLGKGSPALGGTLGEEFGAPTLRLDVRAEVVQSDDASLTQSVTPSTISPGALALITLEGRLSPSFALASTITDTLPTGLTPVAAATSSGGCSIAGQTFTCNASGGSTVTRIVASGAAAGTYTNTATVSTPLPDPNPANNSASGTLTVVAPSPPPPASCHPLELAGVPLSTARTILTALDCAVGTVTSNTSSTVPNGSVISDSPSSGTLPAGTAIDLVVSSGNPAAKPKKPSSKRKKRKKHTKARTRRGHRKR